VKEKGFNPPGTSGSLEISEKNCFLEENPSRGASVTFPWVILRRFSTVLRRSFFVVRRSFSVVQYLNFSHQVKMDHFKVQRLKRTSFQVKRIA